MKYSTLRQEFEFEVADHLIEQTIGFNYKPTSSHYEYDHCDALLNLNDIAPRQRPVLFPDENRILKLLNEIKNKDKIYPIEVYRNQTEPGYLHNLYLGCHRYYLSIVSGFTQIPVKYV